MCDPVARSPSVSQVNSMLTPSAVNGTAQWSTCGPSGASSQRMLVTSTLPTSQPLAFALRAETRYPPSTFWAVPFDPTQSDAPVLTSTAGPSTTLRKIGSASMPWWCRHTWKATRWVCIESATAVDGS